MINNNYGVKILCGGILLCLSSLANAGLFEDGMNFCINDPTACGISSATTSGITDNNNDGYDDNSFYAGQQSVRAISDSNGDSYDDTSFSAGQQSVKAVSDINGDSYDDRSYNAGSEYGQMLGKFALYSEYDCTSDANAITNATESVLLPFGDLKHSILHIENLNMGSSAYKVDLCSIPSTVVPPFVGAVLFRLQNLKPQ